MFLLPNKIEPFLPPQLGEVIATVGPSKKGRIKMVSGSWPAKMMCLKYFQGDLAKNAIVYVVARQGNTMLVVPAPHTVI